MKQLNTILPSLLAAALIGGLAVKAQSAPAASTPSGTAAQREACTPDVWRLCRAVIPDRPAIVKCLIQYRVYLSPACKAVFSHHHHHHHHS